MHSKLKIHVVHVERRNAWPNCDINLVFVIRRALHERPYINVGTDELDFMPSNRSARVDVGNTVQCSRINLSEAAKLPSQDAGSPAWPFRSRKQQLDGLLFSPREVCTSPDDFTTVVCYAGNRHCLVLCFGCYCVSERNFAGTSVLSNRGQARPFEPAAPT